MAHHDTCGPGWRRAGGGRPRWGWWPGGRWRARTARIPLLTAVLTMAVPAPVAAGGAATAPGGPAAVRRLDAGSSGGPVLPTRDPFYRYSGSLAAVAPGTVLRSRTVRLPWLGTGVPVEATQLLYRTTSELGAPTVTVTTVVRDPLVPAAVPLKVVSWQMFYDALGSECDPSYTLRGGNPSYGDAQVEEALMTPYLLAGDVLVVSDYEGENLAWGAGQQSGYQTLDGIRAAEHWLHAVPARTPVALVGYSGGAIATPWAAELAPSYAPELDIVGAAAGGVPVDFAHNLEYINGSPSWSGVIPAVVLGLARAFDISLAPYLSAYGAKVESQVRGGCINSFTGAYPGLTIQQLLKPQYRDFLHVPVFASIVNQLTMGSDGVSRVPLLLAVGNSDGTGDGVMVARDVEALAHHYCQLGVPVQFTEYRGLSHTKAAVPFELTAFPEVTAWLDGVPPIDGCASIGTGSSLAPLPAGTAPPAAPPSALSSADVTSVAPGSATAFDRATTVTASGTGALTVDQLPPAPPAQDAVAPTQWTAHAPRVELQVAPGSAFTAATVTDCGVGRARSVVWWDPAASGGRGGWEPVHPAAAAVPPPGSGLAPCLAWTLGPGSSPRLPTSGSVVFAVATAST